MSKQRKPARADSNVERIPPQQHAQIIASSFQGPLPPPAILEDYDRIHPGLASEIVAWARDETKHRHAMEQKAISIDEKLAKSHVREILLGQIFGFIIAMAFLGGAIFLALRGYEIAAAALGSLGIGSIVVAFIAGRKAPAASVEPKENAKK